jgi:hypothetical protein
MQYAPTDVARLFFPLGVGSSLRRIGGKAPALRLFSIPFTLHPLFAYNESGNNERKDGALPSIRRRLEPTPSGKRGKPAPSEGNCLNCDFHMIYLINMMGRIAYAPTDVATYTFIATYGIARYPSSSTPPIQFYIL